MKILITGVSGFIGSHIIMALLKEGHKVTGCVRDMKRAQELLPGVKLLSCDFVADNDPAIWLKRLDGIEVVINAVGIIKESGRNTFKALHADTPKALFKACEDAGVKKVIQISALGADAGAESRYHLTKIEADDYLKNLDLDWVIIKPSVVFGAGGKSAAFFTAVSALPIHILIGKGDQKLQPVSVDDISKAVAHIVANPSIKRLEIDAVGPEAMTYKEMLLTYRRCLGLGRALSVPTPLVLSKIAAWFGRFIPSSPLEPETLKMLLKGNTGDPARFSQLLGRRPVSPEEGLLLPPFKAGELLKARLFFLKPLLRYSIGLVWIVAGITSAFIFPKDESLSLLHRAGFREFDEIMLYGASVIDIILGLAVLTRSKPVTTGIAQLTVMAVYTLIITVRLPEFWIHPFGPVVKNLPLAVAILVLMATEEVE